MSSSLKRQRENSDSGDHNSKRTRQNPFDGKVNSDEVFQQDQVSAHTALQHQVRMYEHETARVLANTNTYKAKRRVRFA